MRPILGHAQRVIAQADDGGNTEGIDSNYINLSNTFFEYDNPDLGVNLMYPADWQLVEFPSSNGVAFGVYLQGTGDRFGVQVGIFTNDELPASGEPTEQYFQRQVDNTLANMPGFALQTQPVSTVIDGNPALRADFINTTEAIPSSYTTEIWTIKDSNKAYQIESSIDSRYYYDYLPTVEKMLDSLRIVSAQIPNMTSGENATIGSGKITNTTLSPANQSPMLVPPEDPSLNAENSIVDTNEFLTYENDTFGIRLKYPPDWDYYGNIETGGFIDIATFQAPFEGRTDLSSPILIASIDTLPADRNISLADYAEGIISSNKLSDPTYNVLESSTDGSGVTLLGKPAYRILATYMLDNITYTTTEIGTFVDGKVYVLTYDADETEFYENQPIAQEMINSFEVLGLFGDTTIGEDGTSDTNLANMTAGENFTIGSSNISDNAGTMTNQTIIPPTFVNYGNTAFGLKIQYPSNWEIQEGPNDLGFLSPLESAQDPFREGINILVQNIQFDNGTVMSLDGYVNSVIGSFQQSGVNISISDWFPTSLTSSSTPAMKLVYTWDNGQTEMKTMDIYTISGNNAYTITFGAPVDKFDSYIPTIQKMIDSLEIEPSLN